MKSTAALRLLAVAIVFVATAAAASPAYTLAPDEVGQVLRTPDGRQVGRFMTRVPPGTALSVESAACLYPVFTPKGVAISEFAPADHKHHRGIFFAWPRVEHGAGQVADFWGWGKFAPYAGQRIVTRGVRLAEADARRAVLDIRNEWFTGEKKLLDEAVTLTVREVPGAFVLDYAFRFAAVEPLTLPHTSLGGVCARVRKHPATIVSGPGGVVTLAAPKPLEPATAWPDAGWYDFTIPLESGGEAGIAVINHAANGPTRWFNLPKMGMLNPCITAEGEIRLTQAAPLALRYTIVVHDGPVPSVLLSSLSSAP
jgi:hypothetical protein